MIDMHCHVVPDIDYTFDEDPRWPVLRPRDPRHTADVVIAGNTFRTIRRVAWDLGARAGDLALHGVQRQVVSPMPELLSYWAEPKAAARYCRYLNNWLVEQAVARAGAFSALGILPLQDVPSAVELVAEVAAGPLVGVELGSTVEGVSIGSPRFAPVFRALADAGLIAFIHSHKPCVEIDSLGAAVNAAVGSAFDLAIAFAGLVGWGAWSGTKPARILFSHGGGATFGILPRLTAAWSASEEFREKAPTSPASCAQQSFYDTLFFDPRSLSAALEWVSDSQVVIGSDYPFAAASAGHMLAECSFLTSESRLAIAERNPRRLLERS